MALAENLRRERQRKSLTQRDLADRCNISFSRISEIENGHNLNPRLRTIMRLAKALNIKMIRLL